MRSPWPSAKPALNSARCSENIDEAPGGALLHGIMNSMAERCSRNLANEVIKA